MQSEKNIILHRLLKEEKEKRWKKKKQKREVISISQGVSARV